MKLSRIGLLLALPACAASGLSPATAWAGKFARAAERIQAVVPESLKPAADAAAPALGGRPAPQAEPAPAGASGLAAATDQGPSFSITVTPAHTAHDDGLTTQKLI